MTTCEAIEQADRRIGYLMAVTDIAKALDVDRLNAVSYLDKKFTEHWPRASRAAERLTEDIANA